MKNRIIVKSLAITICCILFAAACSNDEKKLQGLWKAENGKMSISANKNDIIILSGDKETMRGTFTVGLNDNKEKRIFIKIELETIYSEGEKPIVTASYGNDRGYIYLFNSKDELEIKDMGKFKREKIPANFISNLQNTFEENNKNPDMRKAVIFNDQVYTSSVTTNELYNYIKEYKEFDKNVLKTMIKNGSFKDDIMYCYFDWIRLDAEHLRNNVNGILKTDDNINMIFITNNYQDLILKSVYKGSNIEFYNLRYDRYSGRNLNRFYNVYAKLFYRNGTLNSEIISLEINPRIF